MIDLGSLARDLSGSNLPHFYLRSTGETIYHVSLGTNAKLVITHCKPPEDPNTETIILERKVSWSDILRYDRIEVTRVRDIVRVEYHTEDERITRDTLLEEDTPSAEFFRICRQAIDSGKADYTGTRAVASALVTNEGQIYSILKYFKGSLVFMSLPE